MESTAHSADIEAIDQVVATVEHSQQHKDPDEFLALFHSDAVWTTSAGKVLPTADCDGKVTYRWSTRSSSVPTSRRSRTVSSI